MSHQGIALCSIRAYGYHSGGCPHSALSCEIKSFCKIGLAMYYMITYSFKWSPYNAIFQLQYYQVMLGTHYKIFLISLKEEVYIMRRGSNYGNVPYNSCSRTSLRRQAIASCQPVNNFLLILRVSEAARVGFVTCIAPQLQNLF